MRDLLEKNEQSTLGTREELIARIQGMRESESESESKAAGVVVVAASNSRGWLTVGLWCTDGRRRRVLVPVRLINY